MPRIIGASYIAADSSVTGGTSPFALVRAVELAEAVLGLPSESVETEVVPPGSPVVDLSHQCA